MIRVKTCRYIVLSGSVALAFSLAFAKFNVSDTEMLRSSYEKQVTSSIRSVLDTILPSYLYSVSTHINLSLETVTIPAKRSVKESKKGSANKKPAKILPGFDMKPIVDAGESTSLTLEDFEYNYKVNIQRVEVVMIFDQSLNAKAKDTAIFLAENRLRVNYGDRGTVTTTEGDFSALRRERELNQWLGLAKENVAILLALLVLALLLIVILFILRSRHSSRVGPREKRPDEGSEKKFLKFFSKPGKKDGEKPAPPPKTALWRELRKLFNAIFLVHVDNPSFTKRFVAGLSEHEKSIVKVAITQSSFADQLLPDLDLQDEEFEIDPNSIEKDDVESLYFQFDDFVKGQRLIFAKPFGYVEMLDLNAIKDAVGDNPEDIALAMKFVDEDRSSELLESYEPKTKAKILTILQDPNFHKKSLTSALSLDAKLRRSFEAMRGQYDFGSDFPDEAMDLVMNQDPDIADTLREFKSISDTELPDRYIGYDVSFEELKEQHRDMLVEILKSADNEIVAYALEGMKEDSDRELIKGFTKMRLEIMENLLRHYEPDEDRTNDAQLDLLTSFRKKLRAGR